MFYFLQVNTDLAMPLPLVNSYVIFSLKSHESMSYIPKYVEWFYRTATMALVSIPKSLVNALPVSSINVYW